jgi:hypothetical protein
VAGIVVAGILATLAGFELAAVTDDPPVAAAAIPEIPAAAATPSTAMVALGCRIVFLLVDVVITRYEEGYAGGQRVTTMHIYW